MRVSSLHARENQIAELTRGQSLPIASIADVHLDVIFETITRVWNELVRECSKIVVEGAETEINALMESRLNHLCGDDPMWSQLVTSVVRGKESLSFDGTHLEKRPDLSVYLTRKHPSFPLVIECKIIDSSSGKGLDLYCGKGICRFTNGEYAWANSDAIMMAYVRDNSSIEAQLSPYLEKGRCQTPDPWCTERLPSRVSMIRNGVSFSNHSRNFRYPQSIETDNPGPIALWHLWLESN